MVCSLEYLAMWPLVYTGVNRIENKQQNFAACGTFCFFADSMVAVTATTKTTTNIITMRFVWLARSNAFFNINSLNYCINV